MDEALKSQKTKKNKIKNELPAGLKGALGVGGSA